MTDWYSDFQSRTDFLGHVEPHGNGELKVYLAGSGRLSERSVDNAAERERVSNMLNRAIAKSWVKAAVRIMNEREAAE